MLELIDKESQIFLSGEHGGGCQVLKTAVSLINSELITIGGV